MAAQQFITVATFIDKVSADIVAERLIAAGIPAAVLGASSQLPSLGYYAPIEVKVNVEDYKRAKSLLAADESAE
jgi:hypothetical protein